MQPNIFDQIYLTKNSTPHSLIDCPYWLPPRNLPLKNTMLYTAEKIHPRRDLHNMICQRKHQSTSQYGGTLESNRIGL